MADCQYLTEYAALAHHRREMEMLKRRQRQRLGLGILVVGAVTVGGYLVMPPLGLMLAGIGAMALFFAAITGGSSVPAHVLSGVEGEVRTLKALKALPDDHVLFNQVMIPDPRLPNGERELDFIVVTPAGISIIEVKNTPGIIYVDPDKKRWQTARRAGCGSRPGWNALDNPVRQITAQAEALDRWLLSHGLTVNIQPVVCFANPGVIIENSDRSGIPVTVPEMLSQTIPANRRTTQSLSGQVRKRVARLISGERKTLSRAA